MNRLHRPAPGFSLIELLVAMAIGLVVTVAVTSVMIRGEGSKRSSTSVNDINQSGAYAAYVLDRVIRSAGSGFSQRWSEVYGCKLVAAKSGIQVLPVPAAPGAISAFTSLALTQRLAPVIISQGAADKSGDVRGDLLIVMGGTAGIGESPQPVQPGSVTSANLRLQNTVGYQTGDIVLLADPTVGTGCMVQQANFTTAFAAPASAPPGSPNPGGSTDQNLPLGGTYYTAALSGLNLTDFGASTLAMQLGRDASNPPQFQAFGVGADRTLMGYDLLKRQSDGDTESSIADGVVEMRAVYGVDTTSPPDGKLDAWVDAGSTGYTAAELGDGSTAARNRLRQIVAIRIGMIVRTSLAERADTGVKNPEGYLQAAGTTLTLFPDLPVAVQKTRTLSTDERSYRFRTVEVTIPLRNVLMAPDT